MIKPATFEKTKHQLAPGWRGSNSFHVNSQRIAFREAAEVYRSFDYSCIKRIYAKERTLDIRGVGQYLLIFITCRVSLFTCKRFERYEVNFLPRPGVRVPSVYADSSARRRNEREQMIFSDVTTNSGLSKTRPLHSRHTDRESCFFNFATRV